MSNLRNRLSDNTLNKRMRIAIEGPELSTVDFTEILAEFKREKNIVLNFEFALTIVMKFKNSGGRGGEGGTLAMERGNPSAPSV